jgi:hypothetical protein
MLAHNFATRLVYKLERNRCAMGVRARGTTEGTRAAIDSADHASLFEHCKVFVPGE